MPKQIFAKEYEDYLITGKEEALNSLASGSIEKEYFIIIRKLLKEDLTPELQKQIDSFLLKIPKYQSYRIKALNIFKRLQKNHEIKHSIVQDIKSLFNLGYPKSHSKPVKYNNARKKLKDDYQKYPNSLNINHYIKTNRFIEDIYSSKIDPNDVEYRHNIYCDFEDLVFDFNRMPEKTLVKIFTQKKDYSKIFNYICQSITYSKLDYFEKVIIIIYFILTN